MAMVVVAEHVERQALHGTLGHSRHHLPLPPPATTAALITVKKWMHYFRDTSFIDD
jgi:hypothetical protein